MTEENYNYRTSQTMLRNRYPGEGKFKIPIIPKFESKEDDFTDLRLIGFDKTRADDSSHLNRMVHFFLYDYRFERVWKQPDRDVGKLSRYRAVLSPDFSMYLEMNPAMQLYNVFRNRWCGAHFANNGMRVIPTISWGDENTFDFCFLGVPKGGTVAVSTYMVTEHDNRCDQKEFFMNGYREMLRQIEPERIICYHTPFPEMEGNIVYVDHELSSWKYMDEEYTPSSFAKYISGDLPLPKNSGIIIKQGHIVDCQKGMGSAYGARWRPNPNKPNDMAFIGEPNTIRRIFIPNNRGGYWIMAKYGDDGWAVKFRHETDHGFSKKHTSPHDHIPVYDPHTHAPDWDNTQEINYPNGAQEFKAWKEKNIMGEWDHYDEIITDLVYDEEAMRFKTIAEFKDCMKRGAEVVLEWKGVEYSLCGALEDGKKQYFIAQSGSIETNTATEKQYDSPDELLEYMVGEDRLRDVITQVTVIDRTR